MKNICIFLMVITFSICIRLNSRQNEDVTQPSAGGQAPQFQNNSIVAIESVEQKMVFLLPQGEDCNSTGTNSTCGKILGSKIQDQNQLQQQIFQSRYMKYV